MIEEMYDLTER